MRWSQDLTRTFLEVYEQFPCLWDVKSVDYKDKSKKEASLKGLVDGMIDIVPDFDVKYAKAKIRSIRNAYTLELHRVMRSKSSATSERDVYKPNVIWFETADRFLSHVVQTRPTKTNSSLPESEHFISDEDADVVNATSIYQDEGTGLVFKKRQATRNEEERRKRAKREAARCDRLSQINETVTRLQEITQEAKTCDDDFDLFGKSVACHLRNLPLCTALECQAFIQNYLVQKRINHLNSPTPTRPESSPSPQ